ncbi:MAG: PAS domain S-box protein, partial [Geobacteraceae bacterium]
MHDGKGNPVLECMCGNIMCGRIDPAKPFFTAHGSFWSNNTTALLASTTEADRQASTRNWCNGMGYESVALIPLRTGDQVFGLIQYNDHRPNRFTPDLIDHFERIADSLTLVLSQRQSEEALRESEAQFRTIFEVASVGIVQVDPTKGRILQCNETFCQITGYSLSELLEIKFPDITHPEDRQRDWEIFSRAMKGEIPAYYNEKRYIRKDGSTIWVRINAAFIRDSNGQAIRTVAVCEDITEHKQTEQSQETARNMAINEKKQLEAVMEALPVGIAIVDERGGNVRSNKIYEELWGSPRPSTEDVGDYEAYKAWWLDTGKPVQPEEWASARATLKGEAVFGQIMEIETFDGVRKIVMNSAAPVRDANGRIVGSAVAIHDITNIKSIEQEVMARASELEAVFSAQNDAVLMYDTGMNVKKVSQAFLSTYGFDPVGLNVREIIRRLSCRHLDGRTLLLEEQPTPRALRGEKVTSSFFVITLPDGSDRIIETSSGPMLQG